MLTPILFLTPYIAIAASLSLAGIVVATCLSHRAPRATGFGTLKLNGTR